MAASAVRHRLQLRPQCPDHAPLDLTLCRRGIHKRKGRSSGLLGDEMMVAQNQQGSRLGRSKFSRSLLSQHRSRQSGCEHVVCYSQDSLDCSMSCLKKANGERSGTLGCFRKATKGCRRCRHLKGDRGAADVLLAVQALQTERSTVGQSYSRVSFVPLEPPPPPFSQKCVGRVIHESLDCPMAGCHVVTLPSICQARYQPLTRARSLGSAREGLTA
jgi:hypothetical protein